MALRDRVLSVVAGQLGRPSGPVGLAVGFVLNRANKRLVTVSVGMARVEQGSRVADVGFGGGAGLTALLNRVGASGVVEGIEISNVMLDSARRKFSKHVASGRLILKNASMEQLPLHDSAVDVVVSTNTIYFVHDLGQAVIELRRVLRPGGRLVLGIGDPDAMAKMLVTEYGFRLRPVSEIMALLGQAGFSSVRDCRVDGRDSSHVIIGVKSG